MNVVELSGGVGGARLGRGLNQIPDIDLTIVVNIGDDDDIHGLRVSADLDTVVYTLAGIEGPEGWGRKDDSFITNQEIGRLGAKNDFALGDLDMAMNILRTEALRSGRSLSEFTSEITKKLGIEANVVPASDDEVRTWITTESGEELAFQEYFVHRGHRDIVSGVEFRGAAEARAVSGSIDAIESAEIVVIAPSNPPLSIWPILSIPGYREALSRHPKVVAVSPLFGGKALKGPADAVMASLRLPPGNQGIAEAYKGLVDVLVVDKSDSGDIETIADIVAVAADTRIPDRASSRSLAEFVLNL